MKRVWTFFKDNWPLLAAVIIPAIIVVIIKYEEKHFVLLAKFYKEGVNLFLSLITLSTLVLAFYQWRKDSKTQKMADINLLFEELRHNINVLDGMFVTYDREKFYRFVAKYLAQLKKREIYPNPTDSEERKEILFNSVTPFKGLNLYTNIFSPRNNYIQMAITSKNIFTLNNQRIFLNLGHLDYSIKRHNYNIENYNQSPMTGRDEGYRFIQHEYIMWLHFRLHFMFVDLIINTPESYFVDQDLVKSIKEEINSPK